MPASEAAAPRRSHTRAVLWAALVAGGLFLILMVGLSALIEGSAALGPPRIIGGLVIGQDPGQVTTTFILVGVLGHFFLSFVFTYLLTLIVYRLGLPGAVVVGAVYGVGLYLFNFYLMAVAFPWFADFRSTVSLVSHVGFGLTAAAVYKLLYRAGTRPVQPL